MLVAAATGVATYARALRTAQQALSTEALLLSGGQASAPSSPQSRLDRLKRAGRSVFPLGLRAQSETGGFLRHDVFRLGQAFFTLHGRLMPVHVPGPPGIMHWSYPVPLRIAGWHNLYTVHDVIPLTHPDLSPIDAIRHRRLLSSIAGQAHSLVAVSQSAATEIAATLNLASNRIVDCSQPIEIEDVGALPPLPPGLEPGKFFIVCGTVEPRKNVERIITAYRASGTALPLVVAGPDGWKADTLGRLLTDTVGLVRLPYQSRASMISLITHARALLMPSLAEGFGLPVGEAMVLGTPVVTSAVGALAETAGDAALLVSPLDTLELANAIAALASDEELCRKLSAAGTKRAGLFSPALFANRLRELYDSLADNG